MNRIYNTAVTNIPLISPTCNKIKNAKKRAGYSLFH